MRSRQHAECAAANSAGAGVCMQSMCTWRSGALSKGPIRSAEISTPLLSQGCLQRDLQQSGQQAFLLQDSPALAERRTMGRPALAGRAWPMAPEAESKLRGCAGGKGGHAEGGGPLPFLQQKRRHAHYRRLHGIWSLCRVCNWACKYSCRLDVTTGSQGQVSNCVPSFCCLHVYTPRASK